MPHPMATMAERSGRNSETISILGNICGICIVISVYLKHTHVSMAYGTSVRDHVQIQHTAEGADPFCVTSALYIQAYSKSVKYVSFLTLGYEPSSTPCDRIIIYLSLIHI